MAIDQLLLRRPSLLRLPHAIESRCLRHLRRQIGNLSARDEACLHECWVPDHPSDDRIIQPPQRPAPDLAFVLDGGARQETRRTP